MTSLLQYLIVACVLALIYFCGFSVALTDIRYGRDRRAVLAALRAGPLRERLLIQAARLPQRRAYATLRQLNLAGDIRRLPLDDLTYSLARVPIRVALTSTLRGPDEDGWHVLDWYDGPLTEARPVDLGPECGKDRVVVEIRQNGNGSSYRSTTVTLSLHDIEVLTAMVITTPSLD